MDCNNLKGRKSLVRTANLLKATLLSYREVVFDTHVTKIKPRNGTLVLTHDPSRAERHPFPDNLTSHAGHREAALLFNQCVLSVSLFGPMTRKLLEGIISGLDIVSVNVKKTPFPVKLDPPDIPPGGVSINGSDHVVVQATLVSTGEKWVIDITSCQYGLRDILLPVHKYLAPNYYFSLHGKVPHYWTETTDQDEVAYSPDISPGGRPSKQQLADIGIEKEYRRHFAALVRGHVDNSLIQGSDAEFVVKVNNFTQRVSAHMSSYQNSIGGT
ncbi:hypothetical protein IL306_007615 [Fusarium sp. DS 682]|nr:hypothetical protein IL306_007615 [Fusarium sp. DS 682]